MTLGKSLIHVEFLENIIQLGSLGTSTSFSPFLSIELGIECIENWDSSWMNIMLYELQVSSIILMMRLFLWMFWEKSLMSSKIIFM